MNFSDVIWFENKFFAASYNGNVHEFDPFPKTKLPNTDEIGKFWPKAYSSNREIYLTFDIEKISLYDPKKGLFFKNFQIKTEKIDSVIFSNDGSKFVIKNEEGFLFYDVEGQGQNPIFGPIKPKGSARITCWTIAKNLSLMIGNTDGEIFAFPFKKDIPIEFEKCHKSQINVLKFDQNYNIFASGDNVGTVISMKNNDKKLEAFIEHNDKTHSNIIQRFDSFLLNQEKLNIGSKKQEVEDK